MPSKEASLLGLGVAGIAIGAFIVPYTPIYGLLLIGSGGIATVTDLVLSRRSDCHRSTDHPTPFIKVLESCGVHGRCLNSTPLKTIPTNLWTNNKSGRANTEDRAILEDMRLAIGQYSERAIVIPIKPRAGETVEDYEKAQPKLQLALGRPVQIYEERGVMD